ncbi:MAG: S1C family serine protease, partial [Eubacteriales bacterium]|nr:S1C family serine protease [Eubacteriales bacterium]
TIEDAIEIINKNLVEVSVSVSETTWFDSTVETKKTYSGIVLEKNEDEILILTMISVADPSDSIKVKFDNGFESEAFIKGKLQRDKLVVLSVPAAEMSVVHLMGFSPCEIAEPEDIKSGVEFIAAGSPLGVEKTYDFGNIGYTIKYESSLDGAVQCFYSKVDASEEFGTFAFDLDGRLLGIALSSDTQKIIGTRFVYTGSLTRLIDDMKNAETSSYIGIKGSNMINPLGVYVEDIDMDSPAYLAGLKKGDIIVGAGEKAISSNDDLNAFMSELRPEETVTLKILRMTAREGFAEMEMEITAAVR